MTSLSLPGATRLGVAVLLVLAASGPSAAQAPMATTGAATAVGADAATVHGTVNANGASTQVTFDYGPTAAYGETVVADPGLVTGAADTAVSAVLGELLAATTYHYRVVATNDSGTTFGADLTFTTQPPPPSVVTTAATSVGADGATLNGLVNAHGEATAVTFEYGPDTSYGVTVTADQSPVTGSSAVAVSVVLSGLAVDTTYHFRVAATSVGGTSHGADLTFATGSGGEAPTAATGGASAVGSHQATLSGSVDPGDAAAVVTFEYGLDTSYGSVAVAEQSPLSGTTETAVSAVVGELAADTTYHYRVVATSPHGTASGDDASFTTLPPAPSAVTGSATATGPDTATLDGIVDPMGATTIVVFEYGPTSAYGSTVTAAESPLAGSAGVPVSAAVAGLVPGDTYHFRVVAENAGGVAGGGDVSFVAGAPAPAASTDAATEIGTTSVTLNATVNPQGQDTDVHFELGLDTGYGRNVAAVPGSIGGSAAVGVAGPVTDLAPNTTYHFRVVAVSGGGTAIGDDRTFTTLAAPSVTTGDAAVLSASAAILTGTVNANASTSTVGFEYGTTTAYGSTVTAAESPVTGSSDTAVTAALSGLSPDTTYHYRAFGTNAQGTTIGADRTFFTSAPAAPVVTTDPATLVVRDGAVLNGTVNANNATATVSFEYGETVAYGTSVPADQGPTSGASPSPMSAAVTSLAAGTLYHYRTVATNSFGTTHGPDVTFTTPSTAVPAALTGPASDVDHTAATLTGVVDPNGNGYVFLQFQYGPTPSYGITVAGAPQVIAADVATVTTARIAGLVPGTTYHYQVIATGLVPSGSAAGGDRTFTTTATVPAPSAVTDPASAVGPTSAVLNGTVDAVDTSVTVVFEYGTDTGYGRAVTAAESPVTGSGPTPVSRTVDTLEPSTTYHFRVVAQNEDHTVLGADQTLTTSGLPPEAVTEWTTAIGIVGATVHGTVIANNQPTTVVFEYGVDASYGTSVAAVGSPVSGLTATPVSAVLTGLAADVTYHYRVVAQNASGTTYGGDRTFVTVAAAPSVTTGAPSAVTSTTAVLQGAVNANGNDTLVRFDYGETTAYGRQVDAVPATVSGTADTPVSAEVAGLSPGTVYHYRVVGTSGAGSGLGADRTLTTGPPPSAVTGPAAAVGTTTARLTGTVDPNGNTTAVRFEYGLDTGYGSTVAADEGSLEGDAETPVGATLTGLQVATTYHYRVVAESAAGTAHGADGSFTTAPEPPTAVTLAATGVADATATLNGTVNAGGAATTVTFEYGLDTAYGSTAPAAQSPVSGTDPTPVSATVGGLEPGRTYHYRVVAENSAGTTFGDDMAFNLAPPAIPVLGDAGVAVAIALLLLAGALALRRVN